jgi:hypothetical protein
LKTKMFLYQIKLPLLVIAAIEHTRK